LSGSGRRLEAAVLERRRLKTFLYFNNLICGAISPLRTQWESGRLNVRELRDIFEEIRYIFKEKTVVEVRVAWD
jgi:hypothetical protein